MHSVQPKMMSKKLLLMILYCYFSSASASASMMMHQNHTIMKLPGQEGMILMKTTRESTTIQAQPRGGGTHEYAAVTERIEYVKSEESGEYEESNDRFIGGRGRFNTWKPYVQQGSKEFSLAQIWIVRKDGDIVLNSIEAGWHVYPELYADDKPRFFIYYTKDNYLAGQGCYNLKCPGFKQLDLKFGIGEPIKDVSTYGGTQHDIPIEIYQDPVEQKWFLKVFDKVVGYWPRQLLPELNDGANAVQWGGEIINEKLGGHHTNTSMGSGHFPKLDPKIDDGYRKVAYVRNMEVIRKSQGVWTVPTTCVNSITYPKCYNMTVHGDNKRGWGVYLYYGGFGRGPECL